MGLPCSADYSQCACIRIRVATPAQPTSRRTAENVCLWWIGEIQPPAWLVTPSHELSAPLLPSAPLSWRRARVYRYPSPLCAPLDLIWKFQTVSQGHPGQYDIEDDAGEGSIGCWILPPA